MPFSRSAVSGCRPVWPRSTSKVLPVGSSAALRRIVIELWRRPVSSSTSKRPDRDYVTNDALQFSLVLSWFKSMPRDSS